MSTLKENQSRYTRQPLPSGGEPLPADHSFEGADGVTSESDRGFFGFSAFAWIAVAWLTGTILFELNIIG